MVSHLGKLHYFCAVGCLVEVHGKNRGECFAAVFTEDIKVVPHTFKAKNIMYKDV